MMMAIPCSHVIMCVLTAVIQKLNWFNAIKTCLLSAVISFKCFTHYDPNLPQNLKKKHYTTTTLDNSKWISDFHNECISDGIKRMGCGNKQSCSVKRLVLPRVGDLMSGCLSGGISAHTQGRLMGSWTSFFLQRFPRDTEEWEWPSLKTEVGRETAASAQDRFQRRSQGFYTWFNILPGEFGSISLCGPPHHSHLRSNRWFNHTVWEKTWRNKDLAFTSFSTRKKVTHPQNSSFILFYFLL